jgi:ABC-type multidrug transport system ATPase subunit
MVAGRRLIVLDEPVSMVDPEAARQFWNTLFAEKSADHTVIFSTHHLGAVRRADKILFIEGGTLAAEGTHDELIQTSDSYRRLFEAQADDYQ